MIADHARSDHWFEKYREILRDHPNGVDRVIRATRYLLRTATSGHAVLQRELGYFTRNRDRMRYAAVREQNLPIGSGVVEAANKVLVTQRMKQSGMRWGLKTGQAILTFRALEKSGRLKKVWDILVGKTPSNDNDVKDVSDLPMAA